MACAALPDILDYSPMFFPALGLPDDARRVGTRQVGRDAVREQCGDLGRHALADPLGLDVEPRREFRREGES